MNVKYKLGPGGEIIEEQLPIHELVVDPLVVGDEQGLCLGATSRGRNSGKPTRVIRRDETDSTAREMTLLCPEGAIVDGICTKNGPYSGRLCPFQIEG